MAQVRIADLPTTAAIDPESFVIIERPGIGDGTFKSTVGDLQEAITVTATVEQADNITTIKIDDINGHTEEDIFTPTAVVRDNGDGTLSIIITDAAGVTQQTIVKDVRAIDPEPTPGSNNIVTSGTIYNMEQDLIDKIDHVDEVIDARIDSLSDQVNDKFSQIDNMFDELDLRLNYDEARITTLEANSLLIYYTQVLDENGEYVLTEDGERLLVPQQGTIYDMREKNGILDHPFTVNNKAFASLSDAIAESAASGEIIILGGNALNKGVAVPSNSDLHIDLNGYTLSLMGPGAGSPGTETNGMQFLKDSTIEIKNGQILIDDNKLKMGIQNYSNLTLDNVKVIGGLTITYVVSNNYGNIKFINGTEIIASPGRVAFDAWYGMSAAYDDGVNITVDDTFKVTGKIEFGKAPRAYKPDFAQKASITCPKEMDLAVTILNPPCEWIDNSDGTKSLRYTGA